MSTSTYANLIYGVVVEPFDDSAHEVNGVAPSGGNWKDNGVVMILFGDDSDLGSILGMEASLSETSIGCSDPIPQEKLQPKTHWNQRVLDICTKYGLKPTTAPGWLLTTLRI